MRQFSTMFRLNRGRVRHGVRPLSREDGFTVIELLIAFAILSIMVALAWSSFENFKKKIAIAEAKNTIGMIQKAIIGYRAEYGYYPADIDDVDMGELPLDPWGYDYEYLRIEEPPSQGKIIGKPAGAGDKGKQRKDRFLVPLNSDFDLYSIGEDGASVPPISGKVSHDDVLRANNGTFIDLALMY